MGDRGDQFVQAQAGRVSGNACSGEPRGEVAGAGEELLDVAAVGVGGDGLVFAPDLAGPGGLVLQVGDGLVRGDGLAGVSENPGQYLAGCLHGLVL